jgi:hypothetical protein
MPVAKSPRKNVRSEAMKLVRRLPGNASWDDLMYRVYVRQKIEAGLGDLKARRSHPHAEIRREFGLEA